MSGPFTYLSGSIDSALNTFVVDVSSSLAAGIAPIIVTGLSIWVTMYGYAVMRHEVSDPINVFLKNAIRIALILGIAISGGIYQSQIITAVNGLADGLVEVVSLGQSNGGVFSVLDTLLIAGLEVIGEIAMKGFMNLPSGAVDILAAIGFLGALVSLLSALGLIAVVSKVALAMVLAFGPLFISTLAFKPIAHFFDQWKNKVANFVMLMALSSAAATLALTIASKYLEAMKSNDNSSPLRDITGFILTALILANLVEKYLPQIASGLTGGAALFTDIFQKNQPPNSGGGRGNGDRDGGRDQGNGGSIEDAQSSGSGNRGDDNSIGSSTRHRVPAYRRASRDRYNSRR